MPRDPDRPPLSVERVVDAAVATADEGGVAALSMRKVADRLGVEAMALYHHVANKAALLDLVVDAVFAEIELPAASPWRAAVERRCWSMRAALSRHSWVLGLLESRDHVGVHRLVGHDAVLGTFLEAGFSPIDAVLAVSTVDSYVHGFVLQEHQQTAGAESPTTAEAARELAAGISEDLPHLRRVAEVVARGPAPTHDEAFAHGLAVVLGGLSPSASD